MTAEWENAYFEMNKMKVGDQLTLPSGLEIECIEQDPRKFGTCDGCIGGDEKRSPFDCMCVHCLAAARMDGSDVIFRKSRKNRKSSGRPDKNKKRRK